MKSFSLRLMSLLGLWLLTSLSCSSGFAVQATSTSTSIPASDTPTLVPVPTDTTTPTIVAQAPFCVWDATPTPGSSQCTLPSGTQRDQFCVSKVPYTLIAIPAGDTYQVLTPGITCSDAGIKNNFQLLTCTGLASYTFAVKVCNADCALLPVTATAQPTGACPNGYDYLSDQQCCQAAQNDQNGCLTLKFDTGVCGQLDCSQYANMSSCTSHKTCKWIIPSTAGSKPYCANRGG